MRWLRWFGVIVLVPFAVSAWLVVVAVWLALWTGGNGALAARNNSLPALERAVDGGARLAGVAGWLASGWGSLSPVLPSAQVLAEAGDLLASVSRAGLAAAPAIPGALGEDGPSSYLVATLNDAELFGSGGAPLNALVLTVDHRDVTIPISGSVSAELNPDNAPYPWEVEGGLPWYRQGAQYPFANSNFHPDFLVSGPNMIRAWNGLDLQQVAGVVTVDITAIASVLEAVGPIRTEAYGLVTAGNITNTLLVDAYRDFPEDQLNEPSGRYAANAQVQDALIDRLRDPRMALRAGLALWQAIPGRHVQIHLADPRLQSAVDALGAEGALAHPAAGEDVLGVFLQSAPSKLATFQQVSVRRGVEIRDDGSATVQQVVSIENAVPEGLTGDRGGHRGYLALTYRHRTAFRVPPEAVDPRVDVAEGRALVTPEGTGPFPDGAGAEVLWQGQDIPPGQTREILVSYRLPPGTFDGPNGLEYRLAADPQAIANPVRMTLAVTFPPGTSPVAADEGWTVDGSTAEWTGALDHPLALHAQG